MLSDYVIFSDYGTIYRLLCLSKINKMVLQVIEKNRKLEIAFCSDFH